VQAERHARSRAAIDELGRIIRAADIDVLVIVSSDHKEIYGDELLPQFAVYWGDTMRHEPYTPEQLASMPPGLAVAEVANQPEQPQVRQGHSELGLHLIHEVSRAGFDPGAAKVLPPGRWGNHGIPHGWGFILQQVLGGRDLPPIVPVFVNTFWEPNPPSARRCYDFGVALGAAISSFPGDLRVGVVASGGLSHFVIDEDLDRAFLKALAGKDREFLADLEDDLLRSGTSELRNWIVAGGAIAGTPLTAQLVDYLPCYRSAAGTGCAMAFMAWRP
jgi:3-O-methylgallate 3,4-dioxygenase